MEMEAARHEHQVMLMRQDLMRLKKELRRMEELHNPRNAKAKAAGAQAGGGAQMREEEIWAATRGNDAATAGRI